MARHGISMAGAIAAALAMSGSMSAPVVGEGQERARRREKDTRAPEPKIEPIESLPGESNRQLAERLKAEREGAA